MWAISTMEGRRVKFYEINGKRNLCGDRIREARQKRRLSQSELCKLLQLRGIMVERDVISRMESGARIVTDFEAVAIAEVLEVPVLWLLDKE
jgi:transcriptional regulator with XRE-family HTH domain